MNQGDFPQPKVEHTERENGHCQRRAAKTRDGAIAKLPPVLAVALNQHLGFLSPDRRVARHPFPHLAPIFGERVHRLGRSFRRRSVFVITAAVRLQT